MMKRVVWDFWLLPYSFGSLHPNIFHVPRGFQEVDLDRNFYRSYILQVLVDVLIFI